MTQHIFLTGFMGSGKTTVGKHLAKELSLPFVDMDDVLVHQFGMSIADVFQKLGEPAFREAETHLIDSFSDQQSSVVGTGGGVPVFSKNRSLMRKSGCIIYLDIHIADTKKRMTHEDIQKRPLWKNESDVFALFEQRKEAYADHDFKVNVSNRSPEVIVQTILQYLRNTRKISSPFTYVPRTCRGEPCVRPRTNNAFVPMYDGRTQGSPLHVLGT